VTWARRGGVLVGLCLRNPFPLVKTSPRVWQRSQHAELRTGPGDYSVAAAASRKGPKIVAPAAQKRQFVSARSKVLSPRRDATIPGPGEYNPASPQTRVGPKMMRPMSAGRRVESQPGALTSAFDHVVKARASTT
jgi:hypothetical protein